MNKKIKDAIGIILDNYGASDSEKKFIEYCKTANTAEGNHSKSISSLILTKVLSDSTSRIIESNKILANAEDRNAKKMQVLTWALIGVGGLQAAAIILQVVLKFFT